MTDQQLRDAIAADPAAKALADSGDDAGCAARLAAALPPAVATTYVNERGIFAAFTNPADAEAVMKGLEAVAQSNPVVRRALAWLAPNNGGIDLGHPGVRAMLDQLRAGGALTPAAVATLKALAERPAAVKADDVSRAWATNRPDGRLK
jgi:hypothetical protein